MNSQLFKKFKIIFVLFPITLCLAQEIQLTTAQFNHFPPAFSSDAGWLVYARESVSGNTLLYKVAAAGGSEMLLSENTTLYHSPSWASDTDLICCEKRDTNGYRQICILSSEKGDERVITCDSVDHFMPVFSPDNQWIAYYRRAPDLGFQIFKVHVDTPFQEIHLGDFEHSCNVPQWSPDGKWILYQKRDSVLSNGVGVWRLYKMAENGGNEIRLTDSTALHEGPQWSPDGEWVVYEYRKDITGGHSQIYKVSPEGGQEIALTQGPSVHESPVWAPDGQWIAYERRGEPEQFRQIYRIPFRNGEEIRVSTTDFPHHYRPKWSPDGSGIVYLRYDDNHILQIYRMPISVNPVMNKTASPPVCVHLGYNYPEPFNRTTLIPYSLSKLQRIEVSVYNLLGQKIHGCHMIQSAGNHTYRFSNTDLTSGVYFFVLKAGNQFKNEILVFQK
jgi:Tol biopolymer transport system component